MKPFHSLSTGFLDFPGRYAVTFFFKGCNIRCPFCHNKDVVESEGMLSLGDVSIFVRQLKKTFLGGLGIVFSGGEPTASMKELEEAFIMFGDMPLCIHTNGLILPYWRSTFEGVVLSVKSPSIVGLSTEDYLETLGKAMKYYKNCEVKQLRYVEGTVPCDFIFPLSRLFQEEGWDVVCEQNSQI